MKRMCPLAGTATAAILVAAGAASASPTLDWSVSHSRTAGGDVMMRTSFTDPSGNTYVLLEGWRLMRYDASGTVTWGLSLTGFSDGGITAFTVDGSGNFVFLATRDYGPQYMVVAKVSSTGALLWTRSSTATLGRVGTGVVVDASGNVIVAAEEHIETLATRDALVLKYDSSGNLLWSRTMDLYGSDDYCKGPAVDPATGNIYVAGGTFMPSAPAMPYVAAFDASGNTLWTHTYTGGGFTFLRDIALHPASGALYAAGDNIADAGVLKVDAATGAELGACKVLTAAPLTEEALAVAVPASGSAYVAGWTWDSTAQAYDLLFMQFDAAASVVTWSGSYDSGRNDGCSDATSRVECGVDPGGNLYVAAGVNLTACATSGEVLVEKWSPAGSRQWRSLYSLPATETAGAVAHDASGNTYAAIRSGRWPRLVKYDGSGGVLWEREWSCTEYCEATPKDIAERGGGIFVTAVAQTYCLLLKYDSSGNLGWVATYGGNNLGDPWVAVDSAGQPVLVATAWNGDSLESDMYAAKYTNAGAVIWSRTFSWGKVDLPVGVATDSAGNIYVGGSYPRDWSGVDASGVVALDSSGNVLWTRSTTPHGFSNTATMGVAVGGGRVYVGGQADSLSYVDAFDLSGNPLWTQSFQAGFFQADPIAGMDADVSGGLLIAATPEVGLGTHKMETLYYEPDGNLRWRTSLDTGTAGGAADVAAGSVYTLGGDGAAVLLAKYTDPAAALSATVLAPSEVSRGGLMNVVLRVANTGGSAAVALSATVGLDSGAGAVKFVSHSAPAGGFVGRGESADFTWTFSITATGWFSFTATVTGTDLGAGGALVAAGRWSATSVQPAVLESSAVVFPGAVMQGREVTVTVTVTNTGEATAYGVTGQAGVLPAGSFAVVSGPSPSSPVMLAGGAAATLTWVCRAVLTGQSLFTVTASGMDANSGGILAAVAEVPWSVTVSAGASLESSISVNPAAVKSGESFAVVLTVSNTGDMSASGVTPGLAISGDGGAAIAAAPAAATIPAHGTASFQWLVTANRGGTVVLLASAAGTDAGGAVSASSSVSVAVAQGFDADLLVFPNPAAGDTARIGYRLAKAADRLEIDVWNPGGERVYSAYMEVVPAGTGTVAVSGLLGWAPGMYYIRVKASGPGGTETLPVVKMVVKR